MELDFFQFLTAGHIGLTMQDYVWNAVYGSFGALTAYLVDTKGEVYLPRYDAEHHSVELGAVGRLIIGASAGAAVGYQGHIPFISGIVAPSLLPLVLEKLVKIVGNGK